MAGTGVASQKNDLEGGEVLEKLGLWLHKQLLVLICRTCQVGLTSSMVVGHLKNKHGYSVSQGEKADLRALCVDRGVHESVGEMPIPRACGPPVQGIAPPEAGFSCTADASCEYSVRDLQTMLKHCRERHSQGLLANSSFRESTVQVIFQSVGHVYFEVDATLTPTSDLDIRRHLQGTFLPSAVKDPVFVHDSDRDRPPLWKITLWDKFEPEVRSDAGQRKAARLLKAQHTEIEHGGIFVSLEKAVKSHHSSTRELLEGSSHPFTLAKVLLNGPQLSPEQ